MTYEQLRIAHAELIHSVRMAHGLLAQVLLDPAGRVAIHAGDTDKEIVKEALRIIADVGLSSSTVGTVMVESAGAKQDRIDRAYSERAALAVAFYKTALALGWNAGKAMDAKMDDGWGRVIYVDSPLGQLSWHIAPRDNHLCAGLPEYGGEWDGTYRARDCNWAHDLRLFPPFSAPGPDGVWFNAGKLIADGVLEDRYIVIKRSDLNSEQTNRLRGLMTGYNIRTRGCVVVEEDWPIFPTVVDMVLKGAKG